VQEILVARGWEGDYPLFTTVNRIVNYVLPPSEIVNYQVRGAGLAWAGLARAGLGWAGLGWAGLGLGG
jgi:hypothetical protein